MTYHPKKNKASFLKIIVLFLFVIVLSFSCTVKKEKGISKNLAILYFLFFQNSSNSGNQGSYESPSCFPSTKSEGDLVLSEIGSDWVEIFNQSTEQKNLSNFKFRAASFAPSYTPSRTFNLPNKSIDSGKFHIIRMKNSSTAYDGPELTHLADSSGYYPYWGTSSGYLELLNSSSQTVDFLRYGSDTTSTTTTSGYGYSTSAPAYTTSPSYTFIARDCILTNTKSGSDWKVKYFSTPAAPNDVTCSSDNDDDGIPDCAEENSSQTYAGWNYYRMGARVNQKDIFLEMDMPTGLTIDKAELAKGVAKMKKKNIFLHFDAGSGSNADNFELGEGSTNLGIVNSLTFSASSSTSISHYELKAKHFRLSRLPVFHYTTVGNSLGGAAGIAEVFGNDIILLKSSKGSFYSSDVLLHELGHNLGLRHGGLDTINYKPNYISIMNYFYSRAPKIGTSSEGIFYYNYLKGSSINPGSTNCYSQATNNYEYEDISFSDGLSNDINESSVLETKGLGRTNSSSVDFNCNGSIQTSSYSLNINSIDGNSIEILKDYDDWGSMKLSFKDYFSGTKNVEDKRNIPVISYIDNDWQELWEE